jgi:hypothetical protein
MGQVNEDSRSALALDCFGSVAYLDDRIASVDKFRPARLKLHTINDELKSLADVSSQQE